MLKLAEIRKIYSERIRYYMFTHPTGKKGEMQ